MASYLVTGGAGFIGSHLVRALVGRGEVVRVFDNFETGKWENLDWIGGTVSKPWGDLDGSEPRSQERDPFDRLGAGSSTSSGQAPGHPHFSEGGLLEVVEGDLRDGAAVTEACRGMDFVMHEGALPSVPRSIEDPRTSHEVNVDGTLNVLEGARAAGVKRVVYAASSSAYGDQPGFPRVETMKSQPLSPYAVQKLAGELYMQTYWRVYGLETVSLRYFNIFGPRQDAESSYSGVIARFIAQMLKDERPTIFGDGEQGRDFTYVENVVTANLLAVEAASNRVAGKVFNVACGERHTLNATYTALAGLMNYREKAIHGPAREGDVKDSLADVTAAREGMGYEPQIGFTEGLRRTVDWYKGLAG